MPIASFGEENETNVGGQTVLVMEPRKWYAVAAGSVVQNQMIRPLLISYTDPVLTPYPNVAVPADDAYAPVKTNPQDSPLVTWPSASFRESFAGFTLPAMEYITFGADGFLMSTIWRNQPITGDLIALGGSGVLPAGAITVCDDTYLGLITDLTVL